MYSGQEKQRSNAIDTSDIRVATRLSCGASPQLPQDLSVEKKMPVTAACRNPVSIDFSTRFVRNVATAARVAVFKTS